MLLVTAMVDRLSVLGGASLVGVSRKRKVSAFASSVSSEHLEDRAMMSAVMETAAVAADVSTASKFDYTDISGDYTPTIDTDIDLGDFSLADLSDAVTKITQKTNKKGVTDQSFKSKTVSDLGSFTFNGKFDKNSETELTGTFAGTIAVENVDGDIIDVKIAGKGVGIVDDPADPLAIEIEVTLTKDVKVGKGKAAVVVASKGDTFLVTLDKLDSASAAKSSVGFSLLGNSYDTTLDAVTEDENDDDISVEGTTVITSQTRKGAVKATTTFVDENGEVIGKIKTNGKFVAGSVNKEDGTAKILGSSSGVIVVNGQKIKVVGANVITVEDAGETLTSTLTGKKLDKLGLSEVTLSSSIVASADASTAKKTTPSVAGVFTTEILDEGDSDVSGGGETTITQNKSKKIKGTGDADANIGSLEGTLEVKKGVITGIKKGTISIKGENDDGNAKTVKAKINKFKVDADGIITMTAHLADGLTNVEGRELIIILTPA